MNSSLQWEQIFRTRRWARTALTAELIRYGSTPMFTRRGTDDRASVVCRGQSTRGPGRAAWTAAIVTGGVTDGGALVVGRVGSTEVPVRAAWKGILAGSASGISPSRTTSGS